jgi:hypothetical protein
MALKTRRPARAVQREDGLVTGPAEVKYLALGDSYTIGESVDPEERYPVQVRRMLAENDHLVCGDPEIIAVTGWTTGDLLEALSAVRPGSGYHIDRGGWAAFFGERISGVGEVDGAGF